MNIKALAELGQFYGSENYYRQSLTGLLITDGIKFLRDNADCQWLLDKIGLAQQCAGFRNDPMLQEIQFWEIKSIGDNKAVLSCFRDKNNCAYTETINYTDFPFAAVGNPFKIWVAPTYCDNKICQLAHLPSEH